MKKRRLLYWGIPFLIIVTIIVYLYLPSNFYVRKALTYWYPTIDDMHKFESRELKATNPLPWNFSSRLLKKELSKESKTQLHDFETVAFLVAQHDSIVFEKYYEGYNDESLTNSFSMAKSVIGLLIGCAIDDGSIKSVDQPISDFLPDYVSNPQFKPITVRNLLTMSAGVDFDEAYTSLYSKTTEIYYTNHLLPVALDMPQIEEPGRIVRYQSGVTQLLSVVLSRATGKSVAEYATEKLWGPLNCEENAYWSLDEKDGIEKAYCCLYSNARDFARLGQLILNNGVWHGDTIVSANYISNMITPDTLLVHEKLNGPNKIFGYQIWRTKYQNDDVILYRGIYGQYIMAIPSQDAVVVRLGKKRSNEYTSDYFPQDIVSWLNAAYEIIN